MKWKIKKTYSPIISVTQESQTAFPKNDDESFQIDQQPSTVMTPQKVNKSNIHEENDDSSINNEPNSNTSDKENESIVENITSDSKHKRIKLDRKKNKRLYPQKVVRQNTTPNDHP